MWYCLSKVNNTDLKAFSIDRITNLTVTGITKNKELKQTDFTEYYKNVFGIVKPDGIEKPTTIIISFERTLGEMLESRPLHPTQKVVSRSGKEIIMEYNILYKPNTNEIIMRDLHRELCKYAGSIQIIEPVELRDEIVKLLEKGIEMNKEHNCTNNY